MEKSGSNQKLAKEALSSLLCQSNVWDASGENKKRS